MLTFQQRKAFHCIVITHSSAPAINPIVTFVAEVSTWFRDVVDHRDCTHRAHNSSAHCSSLLAIKLDRRGRVPSTLAEYAIIRHGQRPGNEIKRAEDCSKRSFPFLHARVLRLPTQNRQLPSTATLNPVLAGRQALASPANPHNGPQYNLAHLMQKFLHSVIFSLRFRTTIRMTRGVLNKAHDILGHLPTAPVKYLSSGLQIIRQKQYVDIVKDKCYELSLQQLTINR
ncbi:hypothetical protein RRG08_054889 [Elysia crispata]|uniref:Uncharacterized protein n=1 Tax=Elysia crispata TaxID=231223 RepID=A0AAE1A5H2_9GAST|nr:hypothetical protein RRG08_054889 [Elysia crispata]